MAIVLFPPPPLPCITANIFTPAPALVSLLDESPRSLKQGDFDWGREWKAHLHIGPPWAFSPSEAMPYLPDVVIIQRVRGAQTLRGIYLQFLCPHSRGMVDIPEALSDSCSASVLHSSHETAEGTATISGFHRGHPAECRRSPRSTLW